MILFEMAGRDFLIAYGLLFANLLVLLALARRAIESGVLVRVELHDPLEVAYLREGGEAAVRTATAGMLARGILRWDGGNLYPSASAIRPGLGRLEMAILERFRSPAPDDALGEPGLRKVADGLYRDRLTKLGLLPGPAEKRLRAAFGLPAAILLCGIAWTRAWIGPSGMEPDRGFLVALGVFAPLFVQIPIATHRTRRGDALFASLRRRHRRPEAGDPERLLPAVAVHGVLALPRQVSWRKAVQPKSD